MPLTATDNSATQQAGDPVLMALAPSNFRGDPAGHVGNQCGHICIGLALFTILQMWLALPYALATSGGIAAIYFLGWEWGIQRLTLFWDSVEDAAFVGAGAAFLPVAAYGQGPGMVITIAIWLAAGAWLRR